MDLQMPRLDGLAATRRIRALGFKNPIIAVTAHSLDSDRAAALDAGCVDFLTKPVRPAQLLRGIEKFLDAVPFQTPET